MSDHAVFFSSGEWTWKQIGIAVRSIQTFLTKQNLKKGSTVLMALNNSIEYLVVLLASLSNGYNIAVISPDLPKKTLIRYVELLKAELCIFENSIELEQSDLKIVCLKRSDINKSFDIENNDYDENDIWTSQDIIMQKNGGVIQLSSGSTETSKIVYRSISSLIAEGQSYKKSLQINKSDVILAALPFYHSYPQGFCIFAWLVSQCKLIILNRFLPGAVISRIIEYNVTILPLVPVTARLLVESYMLQPTSLLSLRYAMVGGGTVSINLQRKFREKFNVNLTGNYGSTETGALCVRLESNCESEGFYGTPMDGVEIQIRDKNGNILPPREIGDIWVRTPAIMKGYLQPDGTITGSFDQKGWYLTGDFGYLEDGKLYLLGRSKMLIDRGGVKVNPTKIEKVLLSNPEIRNAIVLGEKRKSTNEEQRICAFVELDGNSKLTEEDIKAYVKEYLPIIETPDVVKIVDQIPYLHSQKPDYQKLLNHLYFI